MDPDMINCVILRIHVEKKYMIIPCHAIQWQTGVSARNGSKKTDVSFRDHYQEDIKGQYRPTPKTGFEQPVKCQLKTVFSLRKHILGLHPIVHSQNHNSFDLTSQSLQPLQC